MGPSLFDKIMNISFKARVSGSGPGSSARVIRLYSEIGGCLPPNSNGPALSGLL